ncbi:MAG: hypothetical protein R3E85_10925, partial [Planctomycetota bacterium]
MDDPATFVMPCAQRGSWCWPDAVTFQLKQPYANLLPDVLLLVRGQPTHRPRTPNVGDHGVRIALQELADV